MGNGDGAELDASGTLSRSSFYRPSKQARRSVKKPVKQVASESRRNGTPGKKSDAGWGGSHSAVVPVEANGFALSVEAQEESEDPLESAMRHAMETADGVIDFEDRDLLEMPLPTEKYNDIIEESQRSDWVRGISPMQLELLPLDLDELVVVSGSSSLQSEYESGKQQDRPSLLSQASAISSAQPGDEEEEAHADAAGSLEWEDEPERYCQCAISPVGKFRLTWDITWIALLLVEIWATPFRVFFLVEGAVSDTLIYMSHGITVFFFADVALNFFTGYLDEVNETIVLGNWDIAVKYLRFWFWVDLLVTIPYDDFFATNESGTVAVLRATRAQKALRLLRIVKIFRILKLMKFLKVFAHVRKHAARTRVETSGYAVDTNSVSGTANTGKWICIDLGSSLVEKSVKVLRMFTYPLQVFIVLVFLAHLHACIWRVCLPLGLATDMDMALNDYWKCFCWAYTTLTLGTYDWPDMTPELWALHMVLLSERLLLGAFMIIVLCYWGFLRGQADTGVTLRLTDALQYMASHAVSVDTQLQVLASIQETTTARTRHRHFNDLVNQDLPRELQHRLREELWTFELKTLGLLEVILSWNATMLGELAQEVREEVYASSVYVFKEGDASNIAYKVLTGEVLVSSSSQPEGIPPFCGGMWVGEKALINASLKRSGSLVTIKMSHLLAVPGDSFRDLLMKDDLLHVFNDFCAEHLWRGLCGRCGVLGDHFSHECPNLKRLSISSEGVTTWRKLKKKNASSSKKNKLARDLRMFLEDSEILPVGGILQRLEVCSLDDLENLDFSTLEPGYMALSEGECKLLKEYQDLLSMAAILTFRAERTGMMRSMLDTMSDSDHFLFLSHYKLEAGTEASLMRTELGQLIREDMTWAHVANALQTPVFLDSEDLTALEDLQVRVRKSHNLILMLTKNVLTRPWVLLEITTALEAGVQVLLVEVEKQGNDFVFPDEKFYRALQEGTLLGKSGGELIHKYGVTLETVENALRQVFTKISLHYSPHRPAEIRRCELQAILKQCTFNDREQHMMNRQRSVPDGNLKKALSNGSEMDGSSAAHSLSVRHKTSAQAPMVTSMASIDKYTEINRMSISSIGSLQTTKNSPRFSGSPDQRGKSDASDNSMFKKVSVRAHDRTQAAKRTLKSNQEEMAPSSERATVEDLTDEPTEQQTCVMQV